MEWIKEMSCKYCEKAFRQLPVVGDIKAALHNGTIDIFSEKYFEGSIKINYCPMCGKKFN